MTSFNRLARIGLFVAGVTMSGAAHADLQFAPGDFAEYQGDAASGAVIYAVAGCAACHGTDGNPDLLAGGRAMPTKFGDLYAPNISAHPTAGIGAWSNAEFLNAVLGGVSPEGREYFGAVFPFASYARMRPEDALDLRAYMAGLPQSDAASKPHNISYLGGKILSSWTTERGELVPMGDDQMARGQYLVEVLGHCAECHTPRDTGLGFSYDLDMDRPFAGEVGLLGDFAPDISAERLTTFGPEAFVNGALAEGRKLNGNAMSATSMQRISALTRRLSGADRAAIYAYLTGVPLDQASIPPVQVDVTVSGQPAVLPAPAPVQDNTGAKALLAKVNAYCEVKAASTDDTPTGEQSGSAVDPALIEQADQVIETYCRSCHAPGKTYSGVFPTGDIADIPFDKRIVRPGDPDGSPLFETIAANRMPLGQKMSANEVDVLRRWIVALGEVKPNSTPYDAKQSPISGAQMPLFAGGSRSERMLSLAADLSTIAERDRPFMRYFSFANVRLADIDCTESGARRNPMVFLHTALNKFVNSISLGPRPVAVTPVLGTESAVVRIDIRDYGWTAGAWDAVSTGLYTERARATGFSQEAWRDLAVVYPHAIDPRSDPILQTIADATRTPVPIMRADWFVHFASEAPYYDMFLGLTAQIRDLELRLGIDVDREIAQGSMIRAAMLQGASGVSDHNRMLERFDLPRDGYYWKSYDFAGSDGQQSLTLHPDGPAELAATPSGTEPFHHDGGEMIFSLPNGLQGYYLSTNLGDRLLVGPASIVSFRNKPIGKGVEIENARSCFDCHANGIIAKRDQLREVIEASQLFDRRNREVLLDQYIENERLSEIYRSDSARFLDALALLNATEQSATGRSASLSAPVSAGGGEIVTYLADVFFDAVDINGLAREFFLDVDTFRARAMQTNDAQLGLVLSDWISRLDAGTKIHRSEVDLYYREVLPRLTDLRTYQADAGYSVSSLTDSGYDDRIGSAVDQMAARDDIIFAPAVMAPLSTTLVPTMPADRLQLSISVPATNVRVNDLLEFDISTNKRCELQIFYVEGSSGIEELPQALLGPAFLEVGELRRIPYRGSGLRLRFDSPGINDTMLAFCREGGLGEKRMNAASATDYARTRSQPLLRGIAIEAAETVSADNGDSATNFVTFNVSP